MNDSESSLAEIKDQGMSMFQSKSETWPICPMWFRIMFWSSTYEASRSQIISESPDDARYALLNGQNLTFYTLDLCLDKVWTMAYLWASVFLMSRIYTLVSFEPVATRFRSIQLQSTVLISEEWASVISETGEKPVLKSQNSTLRSTPTLHSMSFSPGLNLASSTLSLWPLSCMLHLMVLCFLLSGFGSLR